MISHPALWVTFFAIVLGLLALDLGVFHRKSHEVKFKEALIWSGVWVAIALLFGFGLHFWLGSQASMAFLAGYLIEKSLSVDNLFVFALIFSYFGVPAAYQHRVLFWGIIGALLLRAVFIGGGLALIDRFHWMIYVLGTFLVFSGIKMALQKEREVHPERNPVLRLFRRVLPVTSDHAGDRLFVVRAGRWMATPLFITLLFVEVTDVVFAVDSIPAILAVTQDPFIVYTSNVFAILGLRAMYFALAGFLQLFHYLHYGLSVILGFVGVKLLLSGIFPIPVGVSLGVIAGVLSLSVLASVLWPAPALQVTSQEPTPGPA